MKKIIAVVSLILLVAISVATARMLRRGFSARENPSVIEEMVARSARNLATPAAWKSLQNPQPATAVNVREGMEHFADHCALCHANNGSGDTSLGRGMYPKPPDMRLAPTQDLTDGEIYSIIQDGIRLTGMPAFGAPNNPDDKGSWNLVHFIRHMPKLTPEEEQQMLRLNPKSPDEIEVEHQQSSTGKPVKKKPHTHAPGQEH
ncbi:MAG TPA: cytochrome c [Terriglobales bacterium]|nr:cytochrome c [Terriglobales bacterium]